METAPLAERLTEVEAASPAWPPARTGTLAGRRVVLAETGVGIAAAAAAVGVLAERHEPSACLLTGIAGAYVGSFLPVGGAASASEERFLDLGVAASAGAGGTRLLPLPAGLADSPAAVALPTDEAWRDVLAHACGIAPVPFATSDGISGDLDVANERSARTGAAVESMEGAGAALACLGLGVPFAELRGISNVAGQRDKAAWEIDRALRAAVRALEAALRDGPG